MVEINCERKRRSKEIKQHNAFYHEDHILRISVMLIEVYCTDGKNKKPYRLLEDVERVVGWLYLLLNQNRRFPTPRWKKKRKEPDNL